MAISTPFGNSGPIRIGYDDHELQTRFQDIADRRLPYALATALTRTAVEIKGVMQRTLPEVFDRPTPFTLNSLYVQPATKDRLFADVFFKDFAGKGIPASKYLQAEVYGGTRSLKRSESALVRLGIMQSGMRAVAAKTGPLDQYGNLPGSVLVKVLSQLQAFGEQGYRANETLTKREKRLARERARGGGGNYFAITQARGKLKPGVYERISFGHGSAIRPILLFVPNAQYRVKLPFADIASRVYGEVFPDQFDKAFAVVTRAFATNGGE